ncbi:hypothetical protein [Phenylobacterium sp.]|uniref:hypothetical protein n=1 Tax=Phenylobacterium sp. TaxID=1871053 RepID=UPI00378328E5
MTTIRPNPFAAPPAPARSDAARTSAQQAFFAMATGRAPPTPAAAEPAASPSVRPAPSASPSADPPAKILRPGSLLDIRV